MPTLYVENVPRELYEALRGRARARRRSIAAEVLALLDEAIPTEKELKARQEFLRKLEALSGRLSPLPKSRAKSRDLRRMRSAKRHARGRFPSTEEMQREDRVR
jgi:plasmid stability protein